MPSTSSHSINSIKNPYTSGSDHRNLEIFPRIPAFYREVQTEPKIVSTDKGECLAFFGKYFLFSNFNQEVKFKIRNIWFDCVERYYTYEKAMFINNRELANKLLIDINLTPSEMKRLAKFGNLPWLKQKEWRSAKYSIIEEAVRAIIQIQVLLSTQIKLMLLSS
uniref:DUF1768 domain-containing protein n=1 Tax=Meloidogyne hapla TaxID=6305 RepID=A0A1I8BDI8_MELHA